MLRCSTGDFYTGCTLNLERRVRQHNNGVGSKFTRSRRPVTVVYQEVCVDRSSALRREYQIKRMSRSRKMLLAQTASAKSA